MADRNFLRLVSDQGSSAITLAFARDLKKREITNMLRAELVVSPASSDGKLRGGGQLIVNPPWTLEQDLKILLPVLAKIFAPGVKDAVRLDWIAPRKPSRPRHLQPLCRFFTSFQQRRPWSLLMRLALTFRLLRGAGGVTEAVLADAFPD